MTVRAEKSTRLPDKLPRNRPCFPFSLWQRPRIGLVPIGRGRPGISPLIYCATCVCKKSHSSMIVRVRGPFVRANSRATLTSMISCSFTVRSSSLEPPPTSIATEGRIGTGGTNKC